MTGIYFSGTGNSRYAVEVFCKEYGAGARAFSIEDNCVTEAIKNDDMIVLAYPVQYSTVPKILRDFIDENKCIGCGKCEKLCPMNNIKIIDKKVVQNNQCTMCYQCINNCPNQAITLLGKAVVEQSVIEKYL